jgi:lipoic acid synthetase
VEGDQPVDLDQRFQAKLTRHGGEPGAVIAIERRWSAARAIRARIPGGRVEVLIPDFQGDEEALRTVMDASPDVLNHNIETVPRLYRQVRMGARYERSLELLSRARQMNPTIPTKSGVMVGLGESNEEVIETLRDMRGHGVEIATIGQYLRPMPMNLPVLRYVTPEEFAGFKRAGLSMGFKHVESGPLVRSSYHAHEAIPI